MEMRPRMSATRPAMQAGNAVFSSYEQPLGIIKCPNCLIDFSPLAVFLPEPCGAFCTSKDLSTNDPPSLTESKQIFHSLNTAYSQIAFLQRRMAQLESTLTKCRESFAYRRAYVERHRPLLSAARRIPPEIWGEVFMFARDGSDRGSALCTLRNAGPRNPVLTVSAVCRKWRSAAMKQPRLWSEIDLRFREGMCSSSKLNLLNTWIFRSRSSPLYATIEMDWDEDYEDDEDSKSCVTAVDLVLSQSHRLQRLDMKLMPFIYKKVILPVAMPMPLLESLRASTPEPECYCIPRSQTSSWRPALISNAKNLLKVEVSEILSLGISQAMLPWSKLTEVTLLGFKRDDDDDSKEFCTLRDSLNVLRWAPLLSKYTVHCGGESSGRGADPSPVLHRNLKTLVMGNGTCRFFRFLTAPSLDCLSLSNVNVSPTDKNLSSFLHRSTTLKVLDLNYRCPLSFINDLSKGCSVMTLGVTLDNYSASADSIGVLKEMAGIQGTVPVNISFPRLRLLEFRVAKDLSDERDEDDEPSIVAVSGLRDAISTIAQAGSSIGSDCGLEVRVEVGKYGTDLEKEITFHLGQLRLPNLSATIIDED